MRTYLKRVQSISAIVHIEFGVRRYYFGGVRHYGKRSRFGITENELGSVHAILTTNFELCPNKIVAYLLCMHNANIVQHLVKRTATH